MTTREKVAKDVAQRAADQVGFEIPWEAIIILVEWLLTECFGLLDPFIAACREPTFVQVILLRFKARQILRRCGIRGLLRVWLAGNAVITQMCRAGETLSDETLGEIYRGD